MDVVDEIMPKSDTNDKKSYNNKYSTQKQNNWQEKQNKDRKAIYDIIEKNAVDVRDNGEKFREYLDIQSRFTKYSVGNCLVIMEKAPDSTQITDKESWKEKGIELKDNAKGFQILEPSRSNGKTYYNPKMVYDVSQTTSTNKEPTINYGNRRLLEALLYNCQVPKEAVDVLPNGEIGSQYDKEKNVLYVCRGMNREILFQTLTQEMARIELNDEENNNMQNFISYCNAYMICKKFGVDVSNYNFKNLPEEIKSQKSGKGIRAELNKIKENFERVNSRMLDYFDVSNNEKKKSVPER